MNGAIILVGLVFLIPPLLFGAAIIGGLRNLPDPVDGYTSLIGGAFGLFCYVNVLTWIF